MPVDDQIRAALSDDTKTEREKIMARLQIKGLDMETRIKSALPITLVLDARRSIKITQYCLSADGAQHYDLEYYLDLVLQPPFDKSTTGVRSHDGDALFFKNHYRRFNPPILVEDPAGAIERMITDKYGDPVLKNYREDPIQVLREELATIPELSIGVAA